MSDIVHVRLYAKLLICIILLYTYGNPIDTYYYYQKGEGALLGLFYTTINFITSQGSQLLLYI